MSTSENVTKTDLANIINEIFPTGTTINSSYYVGNYTANVTTTTSTDIYSTSYTSATGKILVLGYGAIKTSAQTSNLEVTVDGTRVAVTAMNQTSILQLPIIGVASVTPNTALTVKLVMNSQSTSTTATMPSYNTYCLTIIDLPTSIR